MLDWLTRNVRDSIRSLWSNSAFALFAVVSLGIGMGAETTLFSTVNAYLFAGVQGVGAPNQLVEIGGTHNGSGFESFSYPDFVDCAARIEPLATLFAYRMETLNISVGNLPERGVGLLVSGNYFDTLQVSPYLGRLLTSSDDSAAAELPVAVATYAAWRKYLNGDRAAIGKRITINGRAFTLVGVSNPEFQGHIALLNPGFYLPMSALSLLKPGSAEMLDKRTSRWLSMGARLGADVTVSDAQTNLSGLVAQLAKEHASTKPNPGVTVVPLRPVPGEFRGNLLAFSSILFVLISMVLLVACINVAGMMIARGEARRFEIAMRYSLGASRARIISQLLVESALLATAAAALGLLLSAWCCGFLEAINLPTPVPVLLRIPMSSATILFAFACVLVTALGFGLYPALRSSISAPGASEALGGRQVAGRHSRMGSSLVVAQIALTLILLVTGGLFLRALQQAADIDLGFEPRGVQVADFDLKPSGYDASHQAQLQESLLDRIRAMPGVDHAALVGIVPLTLSRLSMGSLHARPGDENELTPDVNLVSTGFFETLGIKLKGRGFDLHDGTNATAVGVVNASLAHRLAADGDVIGHTYHYADGDEGRDLTVVGIAENGRYASLNESEQPFLFLPLTQWPREQTSLLAKTSLPAATFTRQLRREMTALDASLPASLVQPLTDLTSLSLLPQRIAGLVSLALGALGLLLAAIGLYGLISMHINSRTREFGVRMAMGAAPRQIQHEVMSRGTRLLARGLAIGLLFSLACAWVLSSLLYGIHFGDLWAFAGATALLVAVAMIACWMPARRAASIDPMIALRHD